MTQDHTPTGPDGRTAALRNLLSEDRKFSPSAEFSAAANASADLVAQASDVEDFWAKQAREYVSWVSDFSTVVDDSAAPDYKWFTEGTLNVAYNCVDRHVERGHGHRVALHWEGEPGDREDLTYLDLQERVCRAANALTELGVTAGDRVAIYLPMIPEAVVAMLACARIGAPHSVIFAGFSADALCARINDVGAVLVITADGAFRRGTAGPLKPTVDEALQQCPTVRNTLVVQRTRQPITMTDGRDQWWHDVVTTASPEHTPTAFPAEHPLFVLYTSGTTGTPKGILHTSGGYLVHTAYTNAVVHDVQPDVDVFWCTADVGWITGHSYIVYGPLANGVTQVLYEGTPDTPHQGRWWEIVARYGVSIFYTAPTAIRTFMKWGAQIPANHDLSSLRLLGTVGEPINPEAWMWYREVIGGNRCPIVDTWWQTETGAMMVSTLPGVNDTVPGAAGFPLPGVTVSVVNDEGEPVPHGGGGYLVIEKPWPGMLRGIWGNPKRYYDTYWSRFEGKYFAGDGARWDADGMLWLLGRVDDVMNISGHRLSTAEVESALVSHPTVAEAAVVGASDDRTGQAISAYVILRENAAQTPETVATLREHVVHKIGGIAKPRDILVVPELPKTRSGKIMRRLLRDVAENREVGDVTTLADHSVMDMIEERLQETQNSEDNT